MITLGEIARSLQGSWLLLKNRPDALKWFDLSLGGFWRSFGVVFLLLPMFWASSVAEKKLLLSETGLVESAFPNANFWAAQFTALGLDWIALPLLLAALAGPLGISRFYVPFIAVRNWSSLLISFPYLAVALLYLAGVVSGGMMVLLSLSILVAVLWYRYLIARITLQAGMGLAIGIVMLDIVLSLLIREMVGRIWGA
ncbi:MAG: hypothetical protein JJ902_01210 [Roseibium sp.]|nr:hypothetical protein [Roseibium sp.]